MSSTQDDVLELAPVTVDVLQAATRLLAGVALRTLDALDSAVTLPQFRMLATLADLRRMPSGQAARALGLDPSTITRLADRLVTAGYVTRGQDSRHRSVATLGLTGRGRGLVAAADAWRRREFARMMARPTPPDQEAVTTALSLLIMAAGDDYRLAQRSDAGQGP